MTPNAKRGSTFASATVVLEAVGMCGRRSAHLLFDILQGVYYSRMEQAQMRLAPKPRSWRDIPRAAAHEDRYGLRR